MAKVNYKIKKGIQIMIKEGPISLTKKTHCSIKKNNISIIKPPYEMLSNIQFKKGYIDIVIESDLDKSAIVNKIKDTEYKVSIFEIEKDINDYTFNNVFDNRSFVYVYRKKKCNFKNAFNVLFSDDIVKFINELSNSLNGLKLFANYNIENAISVKTSTFFNYKGTNYYSGGAERYLLDLYDVCKEVGINLVIYQHGDIPFIRKYNDINVIGLKANKEIDYSYEFLDKQTKNYIYHTFNNTQLHIYSAFQECYPNHIGPSIGISHGISWDNVSNNYSYGKDYFWENKKIYLDGASYCSKMISVDTNTANWFQTVDYNLGNKKIHVIPNYVNVDEFKPRKDYLISKDKIIITYPRRLYEPRGLYIVLDTIDYILEHYKNVEFHFVGKGFEEDTNNIDKMINKYKGRIKRYSMPPERMKEVYKYTDISLIPTLWSEGTSLSCLEAMASGNLVIATRIGGLTDLVINGYNGYLIEPSSDSLKETLVNVLDNFHNQSDIRKNGVEVAKAFNKNLWKEKWKKEINSFNLKYKSKNNELVEFYVNSLDDLNDKDLKLIKKELLANNLVYIRVPVLDENVSYGLLQIVSFSEEVVSKASRLYKKENVGIKIDRSEKIIII